jgi:hypothetical protein
MALCGRCNVREKFRDFKYCQTCLDKVRKEMTESNYLQFVPLPTRKKHPGAAENTFETKRGKDK